MVTTTPTTTQLDFYAAPGVMTDLTPHAQLIDPLPRDIASLAKITSLLVVHRFWAQAYKTEIDEKRDKEQGIRGAAAMVKRIIEIDPRPLTTPRLPDGRVVGICRHFATLLTAFLRYQGVPARARCGFASYFQPGKYVDHWVTEYWNDADQRWIMVDSQLDGLQVAVVKPDFDPLDVPRERFWVAGQASERVSRGEIDGELFGIADMWGPWFVKGDLMLDICALNKVELLPWDVERLPHPLPEDLMDKVADLSTGDAAAIDQLRDLYARDDRLRPTDDTLAAMLQDDIAGTGQSNTITSG
jgi:hypothetical protein